MTNESETFRRTCEALEQRTTLSPLQARGTVRLALRHIGLEARTVDTEGMARVLARIMPHELYMRGVTDSAAVCSDVATDLSLLLTGADQLLDSELESVFQRIFHD